MKFTFAILLGISSTLAQTFNTTIIVDTDGRVTGASDIKSFYVNAQVPGVNNEYTFIAPDPFTNVPTFYARLSRDELRSSDLKALLPRAVNKPALFAIMETFNSTDCANGTRVAVVGSAVETCPVTAGQCIKSLGQVTRLTCLTQEKFKLPSNQTHGEIKEPDGQTSCSGTLVVFYFLPSGVHQSTRCVVDPSTGSSNLYITYGDWSAINNVINIPPKTSGVSTRRYVIKESFSDKNTCKPETRISASGQLEGTCVPVESQNGTTLFRTGQCGTQFITTRLCEDSACTRNCRIELNSTAGACIQGDRLTCSFSNQTSVKTPEDNPSNSVAKLAVPLFTVLIAILLSAL